MIEKVADLRSQLSSRVNELASAMSVLEAKEATFKEKVWECNKLSSELGSDRAVVSRGESLFHDFAERVCTWIASLKRTKGASYRNFLNNLITETQWRSEYLERYQALVGEGSQCLYFGDADKDERCGGHTHSKGDSDIAVIPQQRLSS